MPNLGLSRKHMEEVNNFLFGGKRSQNGLILAAQQCGFFETFQGKSSIHYVNTDTDAGAPVDYATVATYERISGISSTYNPYIVAGSRQILSLRSSDASNVTAGFPNDTAASATGVLRLVNRDNDGASVVGFCQESALWIPKNTAWTAQFEMTVPKDTNAVGVAFQEIGLMAAGDLATHFIDATKEFGYVDGTDDESFVALKFYTGYGYLRIRPATTGTIVTSAAFAIPASGKHCYRLEYNYSADLPNPQVSLYIDDVFTVAIQTTLQDSYQVAGRACHGATYTALTHAPPVFDVDTLIVALHP